MIVLWVHFYHMKIILLKAMGVSQKVEAMGGKKGLQIDISMQGNEYLLASRGNGW